MSTFLPPPPFPFIILRRLLRKCSGSPSTTKSFQALANAYVTSTTGTAPTFRSYPLSFVFSGYFYWANGSLGNQGAYGLWWSNTVDSETNSRLLDMNTSGINPQYSSRKLNGFAVRCVSQYTCFPFTQSILRYAFSCFATDASTTKSFQALANAYVTSTTGTAPTFRSYPLSFVFSGNFGWGNGSLYGQGVGGVWWSSTVYSEASSRYLDVRTSDIYPQLSIDKLFGFAVRCVSLFTKKHKNDTMKNKEAVSLGNTTSFMGLCSPGPLGPAGYFDR